MKPPMSDLPKSRFSTVKAFLHSGCDYAGPFTIGPMRKYRGQKTSKAYICILKFSEISHHKFKKIGFTRSAESTLKNSILRTTE
ncbi:hypothetical protein HHI36_008194 [Cryptolaemus montrouzieri]|uniref:Uncharacterized protein n=1 Tax=Cryptolaemus montrouzieri TaxID=559131 RepID=A0ABD2MSB4_9CUCU